MKNMNNLKKDLTVIILIFFIFSTVSLQVIGYKSSPVNEKPIDKERTYNRFYEHYFPEKYFTDKHILDVLSNDVLGLSVNTQKTIKTPLIKANQKESPFSNTSVNKPMDFPWPMYCHDVRHTGRSPYGTEGNPGTEKWRFETIGFADSDPSIDINGIIYTGSWFLYAINPNGTLKWKYDTSIVITSGPAIDENGILYVGSIWAMPNYLYAIYTNNGTIKWKYRTDDDISSSPVIGDDGIIYFGDWSGNIHALYQNGTLKWKYHTDNVVTSSPAIGLDGTIYVGSHDDYVYAFYPNNGSVKWKYNTGNWVHGSPTIGDDDTVYIGSDNGKLYAFYPNNGTVKWTISVGCMDASPAIDQDGVLYLGVWEEKFYAIYPNGTIKWSFNLGDNNGVWGSSAAISADGTIYFGMCYDMGYGSKGDIIALNPNGAEKWRNPIARSHSSPAIGDDGTVYICDHRDNGLLYAFGCLDPNAPDPPTINGRLNGEVGASYEYTFTTVDPNGDDVFYYVNWDDGTSDGWVGPYESGKDVKIHHTWSKTGTYTIQAQAKDTDNLKSEWGTLSVTMPRNKAVSYPLLSRFLDRFPIIKITLNLK